MAKNIGDDLLASDFAQLGAQQTGDGTNIGPFSNLAAAAANGSPIVGFAFVAPASGRVLISINVAIGNIGTAGTQAFCGAAVRTGTSVGSGTLLIDPTLEPNARVGVTSYGTGTQNINNASAAQIVDGLTPGAFYNCNVMHYTQGTTASAFIYHRRIDMVPCF